MSHLQTPVPVESDYPQALTVARGSSRDGKLCLEELQEMLAPFSSQVTERSQIGHANQMEVQPRVPGCPPLCPVIRVVRMGTA